MSSERRNNCSYEKVRDYVIEQIRIRNCPEDPFVRISSDDIASVIGIAPSVARTHLRKLIDYGIIFRKNRTFYALRVRTGQTTSPNEFFAPKSERVSCRCGETMFSGASAETPETFLKPGGNQAQICRESQEPSANLPETKRKPGGDQSQIYRESQESFANLPETFLKPSGNQSHDSKKELQERKEKKEKEKIVDLLGDWVDSTSPEYIKIHRQATTLFNKYSAGVRRGTSPALINRFVAGCMLEIPLVNFEELEDQLRQAEKEFLLYESFRGTGKRLGIRRPFVRIASYLKKCFEADGWLWSKLTSPFEHRLKRAHRAKQATPVFPQMEDDSKLQPNSKTSTTFSDSRPPSAPPAPPQKKPAQREAGKQNPLRIGDIIKQSGIGKIPPQVVTPQK